MRNNIKSLLVVFSLIMGFNVFAETDSQTDEGQEVIPYKGKIAYKDNSEIVNAAAILTFPKEHNSGIKTTIEVKEGKYKGIAIAHKVFHKQKNGRTVLYVILKHQNNTKIVLRGTVLKGNNKSIYYGSVFLVKHHKRCSRCNKGYSNILANIDFDQEKDQGSVSITKHKHKHKHKAKYLGGFYFQK